MALDNPFPKILFSIFELVLKVKELRKPFLDHIKFIILSVNN